MKLGLMLGYWMAGPEDPIDLVQEADAQSRIVVTLRGGQVVCFGSK